MTVQAPYRSEFTVTGMTCGHCVMSVTEELEEISGVSGVEVELETGVVTVASDRPLEQAEIAEAVTTAGYAIAE